MRCIVCSSGSQTFFMATRLKKFSWIHDPVVQSWRPSYYAIILHIYYMNTVHNMFMHHLILLLPSNELLATQ